MSQNYDYLVGYARADITPEESVPLSGYGDSRVRMSEGSLNELAIACVAITDREGNSILLMQSDTVWSRWNFVEAAQKAISEATGVPREHIMIAATHTHSSVDQGCTDLPCVVRFNEKYLKALIDAGIAAWEDRKEAEMYGAVTQTEGLSFIRHYVHADGGYSGPAFGTSQAPRVRHAYEPDPEMRLVSFKRKGGKDVLMMNWQAHATLTSYCRPDTRRYASSDYVGYLREYLCKTLDCHFIYFNGTNAEINPSSELPGLDRTKDYGEYARLLGDTAIAALPELKKMPAGPVKVRNKLFRAYCEHGYDHMLEQAHKVSEYWSEHKNHKEADKLAKSLGFRSRAQALMLPARVKWPEYMDVEENVAAIGDLAVVTSENEVFCKLGKMVREDSPYPMTFLLTNCNGVRGYLPTQETWDYGSYETSITYFVKGTGEKLVEHYLENLREMKEEL